MSLFAESSWEANVVGDKLSTEIFHKKKKGRLIGHKRAAVSLKKIRKGPKNAEGAVGKKSFTKPAKRKTKNRQKAIEEAVANGDLSPKKWERKSKLEISGNVPKKGQRLEKEEISVNRTSNGEANSRKTKKKRKHKKAANEGNISMSNEDDNAAEPPQKKPSVMKHLNVKRLETMLATKDKVTGGKRLKDPESLRERMMSQLRASRFRFLNETLYTNESSDSKKLFKDDPDAFAAYHAGYKQQVEQWPLNPLDVVIAAIKKMPKDYVIADFGCGEARLAESVSQRVHSFDLVAANDRVKACDMAHTPLLTSGVNVVVFCLSLMGKNLADYLLEANRVLKKDGTMKIAEIESRFENVGEFTTLLKSFGFVNTWKDLSHNLFYFMDFKKVSEVNRSAAKLPQIELKPCLYKKR